MTKQQIVDSLCEGYKLTNGMIAISLKDGNSLDQKAISLLNKIISEPEEWKIHSE